jgi:hypothetical protein
VTRCGCFAQGVAIVACLDAPRRGMLIMTFTCHQVAMPASKSLVLEEEATMPSTA